MFSVISLKHGKAKKKHTLTMAEIDEMVKTGTHNAKSACFGVQSTYEN